MQIEDAEKADAGMEEYGEGKAKADLLPSVRVGPFYAFVH